jgi:hypothetical protein
VESCENGRFHRTHAIQEWLNANSDRITLFRLSASSPSLNLIEQLWGHRKRSDRANGMFETILATEFMLIVWGSTSPITRRF